MAAGSPPTAGMLALALAPGVLLAGVAGGIAFPILPIAGVQLGLSLPFIGLILAANRGVRVVSSPVIGVLTDRFGGRRTLLFGLVVQICVMALYALGMWTRHPGPFFLSGRMLHGVGSACVFVSAQALALHAGGTLNPGRAAGTVRAAIVLGVPVGLVVGGILASMVGDTETFVIAGIAVVIAVIAASFTVPDLRAHTGVRPPLPQLLRELRDRRLASVAGLNWVLNFTAGGMVLTTTALLVHQRHLTILGRTGEGTAGLLMGLMTIADAALTPFAGRLGDRRHSHAKVAAAGILLLIPGLLLVGLSTHAPGVAAGMVLIGVASAGLGPSLLVLMGSLVGKGHRGAAAGVLQLFGDIGGMMGPLVGTALFAGNTAVPYLLTAAVVLCSLPLTRVLVRAEATRAAAAS